MSQNLKFGVEDVLCGPSGLYLQEKRCIEIESPFINYWGKLDSNTNFWLFTKGVYVVGVTVLVIFSF